MHLQNGIRVSYQHAERRKSDPARRHDVAYGWHIHAKNPLDTPGVATFLVCASVHVLISDLVLPCRNLVCTNPLTPKPGVADVRASRYA